MRQWRNVVTHEPATPVKLTPSRRPSLPNLHSSTYPCGRVDVNAVARLMSEIDLPGVRLTAADDVLFQIYKYWVHQNPGTHLDGGIDEDGKWQAI